MNSEILPAIMRKLKSAEPPNNNRKLAGVSVIFDQQERPRILLIRRADRNEDPWSGQVAFPGGKMQDSDGLVRDTAVRETKEEVGIDLARDAGFLGYFGSFKTHTGNMEVIPSVFLLKRGVEVAPNAEVRGYRWLSLDSFLLPDSKSTYRFEAGGFPREMPAYIVENYVVWGLTFRIIESLLESLKS